MSVLDLPSRDLILNHLTDEQVDTQAYVYYMLYQNLDVQHFFNFLLIVNEYDNKYYWNKYLKYIAEDTSIHINRFKKILEDTKIKLYKNSSYNPIAQELHTEKDLQKLYDYMNDGTWNSLRYSNCFKYGNNSKFFKLEEELENFLDDTVEWIYDVDGSQEGQVVEENEESILKFQSFLLIEFNPFWKHWLTKVHSLEYNFDLSREQLKLY
jgi:hypothetical protein